MEQLVILVIIALISFVNWLMQKSAEHKARRQAEARAAGGTSESAERNEPAFDEAEAEAEAAEKARKFMEALGLPPEAMPPPPMRRAAPPPLPEVTTVSPPRPEPRGFLHKIDDDLERRLMPDPPKVVHALVSPRSVRPKRPATSRQPLQLEPVTHSMLDFLRTGNGLRNAVLAREILGPPKGFDL